MPGKFPAKTNWHQVILGICAPLSLGNRSISQRRPTLQKESFKLRVCPHQTLMLLHCLFAFLGLTDIRK